VRVVVISTSTADSTNQSIPHTNVSCGYHNRFFVVITVNIASDNEYHMVGCQFQACRIELDELGFEMDITVSKDIDWFECMMVSVCGGLYTMPYSELVNGDRTEF